MNLGDLIIKDGVLHRIGHGRTFKADIQRFAKAEFPGVSDRARRQEILIEEIESLTDKMDESFLVIMRALVRTYHRKGLSLSEAKEKVAEVTHGPLKQKSLKLLEIGYKHLNKK